MFSNDTSVNSRQTSISLEGLHLHHNAGISSRTTIGRHLLNPAAPFNVRALRRLEVTHERPWDEDLHDIVAASVGSLESLSISFKGACLNNPWG
jgi:hypothetical protein